MFNKKVALEQAEMYDSFYIYDESKIIKSINELKENFKNVKFLYSAKTNPNHNVVKSVLSNGLGVDAASVHEVLLGEKYGVKKCDIQFSAPGKTKEHIKKTIDKSTIIADSLNEIKLIQEVASEKGIVEKIGVRINPNFSYLSDDKGVSSKFGIDEDVFFSKMQEIILYKNIKIVGIHIHIRSQELNGDSIYNYYKNVLKLAEKFKNSISNHLEFINMGSGIGITYETSDKPVDVKKLGSCTSKMLTELKQIFKGTQIYIETGRFVVGKSGTYFSKVLDKKVSHNKTYVILCNTLNGFIKPSISVLVSKFTNEINPQSWEPLYTTKNPSEIVVVNDSKECEIVDLVGNLCTATDMVLVDANLPKLNIGDLVAFKNAGSYSAVLTPMQFSNQTPPKELFLDINNNVLV